MMSLVHKASIKALHFRGALTIANRFFTSSNPNNFILDSATTAQYDKLVNDAGSSGDFNALGHLLDKRVKDGCHNTSNTFNFITKASLSTLDDLCLTLTGLDKGFARFSAFNTLISRLCKLGKIDESLRVVKTMARADCSVKACSFHPIIKALMRRSRVDEAWRVVDLMRSLGVSPDSTTYNFILLTHCAEGNLSEAATVLTRMEEQKMKANGRTYDALVLGACRAGKVEGALVVLRRMEEDGVPMLLSTRLYVIDALMSLGYYDQAMKFLEIYFGKDTWLDQESFGSLAIRFLKLNRIEEAKLVLKIMKRRGLEMRKELKEFQENEC